MSLPRGTNANHFLRRFGRAGPAHALTVIWLLTTAVLAAATVLVLWELRAMELTAAQREIENLTKIFEEQTVRTIQGVDLLLEDAKDHLQLEQGAARGFFMETEALRALLHARIESAPQIRSLFGVAADGRVILLSSYDLSVPGAAVEERDFFRAHKDDPNLGLYFDKPSRSHIDGSRTIAISRRLNGPNGTFGGVITAAIDAGYFEQLYSSIELGAGSEISLYMRDGTLLARQPHPDGTISSFAGPAPPDTPQPDAAARILRRTAGGSHLLTAHRGVGSYPLVVAVAVNESAVLANWRRHAMLMASGAMGIVLILALAAAAVARELARDEKLTKALQDSEARLHGIIDSAMDAIITVDDDQRIVLFNPAAEKMFRCSSGDVMGASLDRLIPQRNREAHRRHLENYGQTGMTSRAKGEQINISAVRADGEEFPIDASISQITRDGKKFYTAIVRDVTTRRQAEEQLRRSHQQLRELSASLQAVREEERTRIARELHDELGQQLTGLKMDLSWMASKLREDQTNLADKINGMKRLVDATVGSVRRIASELRPLMLDDLGLVPAVEWLVTEFSRKTGIEVNLDFETRDLPLGDSVATSVFRILQESLTNVVRHAEATQVRVSLAYASEHLVLRVQDNGKGMAPNAQYKTRSYGLIGIRERAHMLGGDAQISSRQGEGTTIEITLPMHCPATEEHG